MSKPDIRYPESYKPTFDVSPQLVVLATQMGLDNMRETIDPDITDAEIDELLEKIEIESGRKRYLMEIVRTIVKIRNETDPIKIMNIKIQVLLDNLAKKLCRCTEKDRYSPDYDSTQELRSKEGLCRSSIFQGRNIDYITHDCGEPPEDRLRYKYGMGPLLRPALSSNSKVILRRYSKKQKTEQIEKEEPKSGLISPVDKIEKANIVQESVKNCTFKQSTGRCLAGEPNMPQVCIYNPQTKRCKKK